MVFFLLRLPWGHGGNRGTKPADSAHTFRGTDRASARRTIARDVSTWFVVASLHEARSGKTCERPASPYAWEPGF